MKRVFPWILIAAILLIYTAGVSAAGDEFSLAWWTASSGGETSTAGEITLAGTFGQPEAGLAAGGEFSLAGGFWVPQDSAEITYRIHLPLVVR